jgi:hypothetical protein
MNIVFGCPEEISFQMTPPLNTRTRRDRHRAPRSWQPVDTNYPILMETLGGASK